MLLDFITLNISGIFISSILLNVVNLNDKRLYYILIIDIIINKYPIITIIIILLYKFKIFIFKYFKENISNLIIFLIIYYFIFGSLVYGIYNGLDRYIFNYLLSNLPFNIIIFFIGLKYSYSKYNLVGETDA